MLLDDPFIFPKFAAAARMDPASVQIDRALGVDRLTGRARTRALAAQLSGMPGALSLIGRRRLMGLGAGVGALKGLFMDPEVDPHTGERHDALSCAASGAFTGGALGLAAGHVGKGMVNRRISQEAMDKARALPKRTTIVRPNAPLPVMPEFPEPGGVQRKGFTDYSRGATV